MNGRSDISRPDRQRNPQEHQHGLSLIELMIAITLGLLIMTALITLFVDTSRTNTEMAKVNTQIENGRFAMQLIQNDVVHGGFWGGYVPAFDDLTEPDAPTDTPTAIPAPCRFYDTASPWSDTDKANMIGIPIQAYDDIPTGCSTATATATDSPIITNKKANTDVLVVRHAATCLPSVGNCEAIEQDNLYFQFSRCENETGAATPLLYKLEPAADATASNLTLKKRGCTGTPPAATVGTVADIRKFVSAIYYIRDYATTPGDGIPTLMRSEFDLSGGTLAHKAAEPLINGIEGFRVELGIDNVSDSGAAVDYTAAVNWADPDNLVSPTNRGDGSPDEFVRCPLVNIAADTTPPSTHPAATVCTTAQLTNVVAVKLYVLARAEKETPGYTDTKTYNLGTTSLGPFNDRFKRHVFSTTVRLTNVSGRRETP